MNTVISRLQWCKGQAMGGTNTIAGVLRVGVEVQVGDVGSDLLDIGCVWGHQAANVAPCRARTGVQGTSTVHRGKQRQCRLSRACVCYSCLIAAK